MKRQSVLIALSLVFACCLFAQERRVLTLDIKTHGLRNDKESNPDNCASPFQYYRAVRWLDNDRFLVVFNTSPVCPKDDHSYPLPSTLRLLTFDIHGNVLHSSDVAYVAQLDEPSYRRHDDVWVGPGSTVLVYIPGIPKSSLRVFTGDLNPLQALETDSYAPDVEFEGVSPDQGTVIFSAGEKPWTKRSCVAYKIFPLERSSECPPELLSRTQKQFEDLGTFPIPAGYTASLLNNSDPSRRSLIFTMKQGNGACQLAGVFCPLHGHLIIYDQLLRRTVSNARFPDVGRAALSPDGRRLATLVRNKLEIFEVP